MEVERKIIAFVESNFPNFKPEKIADFFKSNVFDFPCAMNRGTKRKQFSLFWKRSSSYLSYETRAVDPHATTSIKSIAENVAIVPICYASRPSLKQLLYWGRALPAATSRLRSETVPFSALSLTH